MSTNYVTLFLWIVVLLIKLSDQINCDSNFNLEQTQNLNCMKDKYLLSWMTCDGNDVSWWCKSNDSMHRDDFVSTKFCFLKNKMYVGQHKFMHLLKLILKIESVYINREALLKFTYAQRHTHCKLSRHTTSLGTPFFIFTTSFLQQPEALTNNKPFLSSLTIKSSNCHGVN